MAEKKQRYSNAFRATFSGITDLFRKQQNAVLLEDTDRLDGKNVLITGASSGLGFEAAVQLAKRGAHVWMACRSGIPGKMEEVKKRSGSRHVEILYVDLADLGSIMALVNKLKAAAIRFDVVIDNAGVVPGRSRKTKQGLEEMFVVNYLSKYLLARLLLDYNLLVHEGPAIPRMVYVVSESHRNPRSFDFDGFGMYKEYSMGKTVELYGYYKLLLATFASTLSRRINGQDKVSCSVFALCPGPVNSNIAREAPILFKPLLKIVFAIFFRSPEVAVKPVIYLAASAEVQGKATDYLFLMSRKEMDSKALDTAQGDMLWQLSETLLEQQGIVFSSYKAS